MVKIVIEVSEEFIKNEANPENLKNSAEQGGKDALSNLFKMLCYSALEHQLDKGVKEFTIKEENLEEHEIELFKGAFSKVAILAASARKEANDEK